MYASERIDDTISQKTATDLAQDLNLVELIARFQFKTAHEATHLATSIELTDLGVFKTTKTKLTRKLNTFKRKLEIKSKLLEDDTLNEKKQTTVRKTCDSIKDYIETLNRKLVSYED